MEQPAAGQAVIEPGPIRADSAMLYVLHDETATTGSTAATTVRRMKGSVRS